MTKRLKIWSHVLTLGPFPLATTDEDPLEPIMDGRVPADPPFWRELLDTTLSYMKWGYGALGFSIFSYLAYLILKGIFA
jgi:hypothetical protein